MEGMVCCFSKSKEIDNVEWIHFEKQSIHLIGIIIFHIF